MNVLPISVLIIAAALSFLVAEPERKEEVTRTSTGRANQKGYSFEYDSGEGKGSRHYRIKNSKGGVFTPVLWKSVDEVFLEVNLPKCGKDDEPAWFEAIKPSRESALGKTQLGYGANKDECEEKPEAYKNKPPDPEGNNVKDDTKFPDLVTVLRGPVADSEGRTINLDVRIVSRVGGGERPKELIYEFSTGGKSELRLASSKDSQRSQDLKLIWVAAESEQFLAELNKIDSPILSADKPKITIKVGVVSEEVILDESNLVEVIKEGKRLAATSAPAYKVRKTKTFPVDNKIIPDIGPTGEITNAFPDAEFVFTEGPAVDKDGNVYFTDVRDNKIMKADTDGKLSVITDDSKGCNGLMFDGKGRLVACQGGEGRVIAIDLKTRDITVLADKYNGKRFNRPNDLVVDKYGGVYFTDPGEGESSQDMMAVYYVSVDKRVTRLIDGLQRPNGVILSPDERWLYVVPSGSPDVMIYSVESAGKIGKGMVFCKLEQAVSGPPRGGDGLTVDTKGNLYFTQPALQAIQVVSPEGKTLGLIKFPANPSNCCFGGKDMKTLFVTANSQGKGGLYGVRMEATGHRFPGGGQQ